MERICSIKRYEIKKFCALMDIMKHRILELGKTTLCKCFMMTDEAKAVGNRECSI